MNLNLTEFLLWVSYLGAEWVLWLLVGLSFLSVTIMVERWMFFVVRRVNVDQLANRLNAALQNGNLEQALALVQRSKAIECRVLAAGLRELHRGAAAVSEVMLSVKARERLRQEQFLPMLGTLGSNAPFIGLLGTVLGIIKAAHDMSQAQAGQEGAANAVMAGVFEALVATALGLVVAIPAVVAFNYFQRRVRSNIGQADALAHMLLSTMKSDQAPSSESLRTPRQPKPAQVTDGR